MAHPILLSPLLPHPPPLPHFPPGFPFAADPRQGIGCSLALTITLGIDLEFIRDLHPKTVRLDPEYPKTYQFIRKSHYPSRINRALRFNDLRFYARI